MTKTVILGGDNRQRILKEILDENKIQNDSAFTQKELSALGQLSQYGTLILPLPCTKDGKMLFSDENGFSLPLSLVAESVRAGALAIGGNMPQVFCEELSKRGADVLDYFKDESFTIYNAFLTAQGAVRLLLENTREYLVSKRVLVVGFGRIGRALAKMLSSLGLDVYVAARRSQTLAEASALGYKALDTAEIESTVYLFDFVFNTVPERIFSSECVSLMKSGAVYFELASSPYGAERGDFEKSKARFVSGSALPGRFCPRSCAEAVFGRISKYI